MNSFEIDSVGMALISGLTSHSGQIKGDDPHVGYPGWGLGVRPTTTPSKKKTRARKSKKLLEMELIHRRLCDYKER
jgi:hypothetical protein